MTLKNIKITHKLAISFGLIFLFIIMLGLTAWIGFNAAKKNSENTSILSEIESKMYLAHLELKNYTSNPTDSIYNNITELLDECLFYITFFENENSGNSSDITLSKDLTDAIISFKNIANTYFDHNKGKDIAMEEMVRSSDNAIEIAFSKARQGIVLDNRGFINFLSAKISEKEFLISPAPKKLDNWRLFVNNAIRINRDGNMAEVADGLQEYANQFEVFAAHTQSQIILLEKLEKVANETLQIISEAQNSRQELLKDRLQNNTLFLFIIIFLTLFGSFLIFRVTIYFIKPIKSATQVLIKLSQGNLNDIRKLNSESEDEIGKLSKAMNNLIDGLNQTAVFANQIGNKNLDAELITHGQNDVLGNSLIQMRESLKNAEKESESRKIEEEKRTWINKGIAEFADILRQNTDNINELGHSIIKNIVKYLNAVQGGIFLLNEDDEHDKHLELIACYAYDRQKHLKKRINIGEGLVGACYLEKKSSYIMDLPEDYLKITSGMGDAPPSYLIVIPVKVNDDIYGVMEIASFYEIQEHQIEFLDNVSEDIASTIASVKTNLRTAMLLEKSEHQAKEMREKELEMKQIIEELRANQEELEKMNDTE